MVGCLSGVIMALAVAGAPAACHGVNLAENGGFDDWNSLGDAVGWNEIEHQWITYQQSDICPLDTPCMEVLIGGNTPNGVWQRIEVGPGAPVCACASVRTTAGPGQSGIVRVGIEPWGDDSILSADMVWSDAAPLNAYADLLVETVSKGQYISVFIGGTTGSIPYTVDDVVVTPEPATFVLFGLAGLTLLHNRRR